MLQDLRLPPRMMRSDEEISDETIDFAALTACVTRPHVNLAPAHRSLKSTLGIAFFDRFAFVMQLFAADQAHQTFG